MLKNLSIITKTLKKATLVVLLTVASSSLGFVSVAHADYSATTTATTSGTFIVPAGVTSLTVSLTAAGGGGAGGAFTYGGGGGGAGDSLSNIIIPVIPGQSIPMTVGVGGAAGAAGSYSVSAGNGGNGSNTIFGTTTVLGGQGGFGATVPIYGGVGGQGGIAGGSNGTNGSNGAKDFGVGRTYGGNGGTTPFGTGGQGSVGDSTAYISAPVAGTNGNGGGAGSGWTIDSNGYADKGAQGGNGLIVVSYFADLTAPVITINGSTTLTVAANSIYTDLGATAFDAVDGTTTVNTTGAVNTNATGTYFILYTATDLAGNVATATRTVIVADQTAPVITAPVDQTFEATGATTTPALVIATAVDNIDPSPVIIYSPASFALGTTTVVWTATDNSGNISTTTSLVVIKDTTAPVVTLNGSSTMSFIVGTPFIDPGATAFDLVDGTTTVNVVFNTVNANATGTYFVGYSSTDAQGNTSGITLLTVNVIAGPDTIAPVITILGNNPDTVLASSTGIYVDAGATAFDNIDGTTTVNVVSNNVDMTATGTYTIVYSSTDASANVATSTRTVNVVSVLDTTAPAITILGNNPDTVISSSTGVYVDAGATAFDNVDGTTTVNVVSNNVNLAATGTYTIVYSSTDSSSNVATATRTVNVVPPAPAVLTTITLAPQNAFVLVGSSTPFTAVTLDQYGQPFAATVIFVSSNNTAGTINPFTGVFSGLANGTTSVTAFSGSLSASTTVTVSTVPPMLNSISIAPLAPTLAVNATTTFAATTLDQYNNPFATTTSWTSSDPLIGTIDPVTGLFTAASVGTTTVTGTAGSLSTSTVVTVSILPNLSVMIINSLINSVYYASEATTSGAIAGITGTTSINSSTINSSSVDNSSISTSTLVNSTISFCTVLDSTVIDFTGTHCYIDPTTMLDTYGTGNSGNFASSTGTTTIDSSNFDHSDIDNSHLVHSTVNYSTTSFAYIFNSNVQNSVENYSTTTNSTIASSTFNNATVDQSNVSSSNIATSSVASSTVSQSTVTNSNVATSTITNGSTVASSSVTLSTIDNSQLSNGTTVSSSTLTNVVSASSSITNTTLANATTTNAVISNGTIFSGTITINGTTYDATANGPILISSIGAATLSSIAITTPANKTTYLVGDSLDITGLVVTGTWSDNSTTTELISTSSISGFDSSTSTIGQVLTITDGTATTSYTVDINAASSSVAVTSVSLAPATSTLMVGATTTLAVTILPVNATDQTVTWASDNSLVATVSNGVVTGVATGTANITATTNDGTNLIATSTITVVASGTPAVLSSISIAQLTPSITVGATTTFTATTLDQFNNPFATTTSWISSNASVGTIDPVTGVFTAVATGTTDVTGTAGSFSTSTTVTVTPVATSSVLVSGVTVNKPTDTIIVGNTDTITATIAPANATNQNIVWATDNSSVATVANGVVTAVATGTANITVTTVDGGFVATSTVTVVAASSTISVSGVTVNKPTDTITVGNTDTIIATIAPANATNQNVNWASDNASVASVSGGVVTAVASGTANITVTTVDGGFVATSSITVVPAASGNVAVTGVTLNQPTLNLNIGDTATLLQTITPANATNQNITWASDNTSVASVANGIVTAVASGTANITVTTVDGGFVATSTVNVSATSSATTTSVTGVMLNQPILSLTVGNTGTLVQTIAPANATNQNITWASDNTSVATVSNGVVTAVATGTANVTVTTQDGNFVATTSVTVTAPATTTVSVTGVTVDKPIDSIIVGNTDTITATISPATSTNQNVNWASDNTAVATVINGVVTAVATGTANVTVTTVDGGFVATSTITVTPVATSSVLVSGVTVNKPTDTIIVGNTDTITATIAPANATNQNIVWATDNSSVATVANGVVTAVATGTANITVTTVDGGFVATSTVTVTVGTSTANLVSIAITIPVNKTVYTVGDALDLTGLVVLGTYNDGSTSTQTITAANISGFNTSVPNNSEVLTITAGPVTTTYTIIVNPAPAANNGSGVGGGPVIIVSSVKPTITINGGNSATINVGANYIDLGASAVDNTGTNITARITTSGSVNTSFPGTYTITYTAQDRWFNTATAVRTITVLGTNVVVTPTTPVANSTTTSTSNTNTPATPTTSTNTGTSNTSGNGQVVVFPQGGSVNGVTLPTSIGNTVGGASGSSTEILGTSSTSSVAQVKGVSNNFFAAAFAALANLPKPKMGDFLILILLLLAIAFSYYWNNKQTTK